MLSGKSFCCVISLMMFFIHVTSFVASFVASFVTSFVTSCVIAVSHVFLSFCEMSGFPSMLSRQLVLCIESHAFRVYNSETKSGMFRSKAKRSVN